MVIDVVGPVVATRMAFGSDERTLVYRAATGVTTRRAGEQPVDRVRIAPYGDCYDTGGGFRGDRTAYWESRIKETREISIRAWDVRNGHALLDLTFTRPGIDFATIAFTPDLGRIIAAYQLTKGRAWSWQSPPPSGAAVDQRPSTRVGAGPSLTLSSDGRVAAWLDPEPPSLAPAAKVQVLLLDGCIVRSIVRQESAKVSLVAVTNAGLPILASEGSVHALGAAGRPTWSAPTVAGRITRAAVSPDGSWVAAALEDGGMTVARPGDAAPRLTWSRRGAAVTALALAPGGRWIAAGTAEGQVTVWPIPALERELAGVGLTSVLSR
jgi:WD40 repeat protein